MRTLGTTRQATLADRDFSRQRRKIVGRKIVAATWYAVKPVGQRGIDPINTSQMCPKRIRFHLPDECLTWYTKTGCRLADDDLAKGPDPV